MALDQHNASATRLDAVIALADLIFTPLALPAAGIGQLPGLIIGVLRKYFDFGPLLAGEPSSLVKTSNQRGHQTVLSVVLNILYKTSKSSTYNCRDYSTVVESCLFQRVPAYKGWIV